MIHGVLGVVCVEIVTVVLVTVVKQLSGLQSVVQGSSTSSIHLS